MIIAWSIFTAFVVISFLWFGRSWLMDVRRWHIGWMSFSYTVMVVVRLIEQQRGETMACTQWDYLQFTLWIGMFSGVLGLYRYWYADAVAIYKLWKLKHGKRREQKHS